MDFTAGYDLLLDTGFTIAPLQGHLFDPDRTPLLGSVKLRNRVLQQVIELMSLSRGGGKRRRGRISYGTLGINQLGAVYESLLSFRGFFAEEDLYEVRPDPKGKRPAQVRRAKTVMPKQRTPNSTLPATRTRKRRRTRPAGGRLLRPVQRHRPVHRRRAPVWR